MNELCDNHVPTRHVESIKNLLEHFYIYDDGEDDFGEYDFTNDEIAIKANMRLDIKKH